MLRKQVADTVGAIAPMNIYRSKLAVRPQLVCVQTLIRNSFLVYWFCFLSDTWPELFPFLGQCAQSPQPGHRIIPFWIFQDLAEVRGPLHTAPSWLLARFNLICLCCVLTASL